MLGTRFSAPARPSGTPLRVPDAWLVPGLLVFLGSLFWYLQELRRYQFILWGGLDLKVYQGGGLALRHGQHVYDMGWTDINLPYTYPPITLLPNALLSMLTHRHALILMSAVTVGCVAVSAWYALGMAGVPTGRGRLGLTAAIAGLSVWLEPVLATINLGQVNAIVMVLVIADLAQPDRRRWKGVGIGLATGIKLVPGLFIVYLLLTRRFRAAVVSAGVFVGTVLLGFLITPGDAARYWGGEFLDSKRVASVVGVGYLGNQSLHGFAARLTGDDNTLLWLPLALLVLVGGMLVATLTHQRGQELLAVLLVAITALLITPVAWSHHWVWVVPLLIFAWSAPARLAGNRQVLAQVGAAILTAAFVAWPFWDAAVGPVVPLGLIWHTTGHLGTGLIGSTLHETYTIAGVGLIVGTALWLWLTRTRTVTPAVPAQRHGYADDDQLTQSVTVPRQKTPVEALDTAGVDRTLA